MPTSSRAIICITPKGKETASINYSRRMYAIIRRYTPEAVESGKNECFAELTGLRTFFKMSYQEITEKIINDLSVEIGIRFKAHIAKSSDFEKIISKSRKPKNVSTYKEINTLFAGRSLASSSKVKNQIIKRVKLTVPFLGKVA
jgi:nucleotidyltransferase/DNA polymerase involved in DNA repair